MAEAMMAPERWAPLLEERWPRELAFQGVAMMLLLDLGFLVWDTSRLAAYSAYRQTGAPDIVGIGEDGRFIACELKAADGEPTAHQRKRGSQIVEAGGRYAVCHTLGDVLRAFDAIVE